MSVLPQKISTHYMCNLPLVMPSITLPLVMHTFHPAVPILL